MAFQTIEGKLYKLHLDNWEPFIKAMDDDFNKINEFKFHHPQNTHKEFFRHYVYLPANGCTFMMVGQMRKAEDSACVRIVIHSVNFKDSYLAIYDYEHCFRNPDLMAGMLVRGFNDSLKGTGLRMTFEPWDTMGKDIRWFDDHELTYNINYHRTMGKHVSKMGYEDLKAHHKKVEARNEKRKEAKRALAEPKKELIEHYILENYKDKKDLIMFFLRDTLKNRKGSKKVSLPFRLLMDKDITGHIPSTVILKEMPELEGRVSDSRYYHWTNMALSNYDGDKDYEETGKRLEDVIKVPRSAERRSLRR